MPRLTSWHQKSWKTLPVHSSTHENPQYILYAVQNEHFAISNTEQITTCYVTATRRPSNCTAVSVFFSSSYVYTVSVLNIVCF